MTVGEMHRAIQQGVDKINSFQADMLLPQELDLELNQAQYKFINIKYGKGNKYQKGFEESQKRIDDIRTLVTEIVLPTTFKEQVDTTIFVDTAVLPDDYMYLVNSRSHLQREQKCSPLDQDEDVTLVDSSAVTHKYVEFPMDNLIGASLLDSVHAIYLVKDITNQTFIGYPSVLLAPKSTLWDQATTTPLDGTEAGVAAFQTEIEAGSAGVYTGRWQDFYSLHSPGNIILELDSTTYAATNCDPNSGMVWTAFAVDGDGNELYRTNVQCLGQGSPRRTLGGLSTTPVEEKSVNKYVQQDDIFTLIKDPFNTTKIETPLFTIRDNKLDFYTSDIFIIPEVKLTYIRKPAEISLSLQVSCELPEHSHREIVDMAVSSILESISDPRYKTHEVEANKNE